MSAEYRLCELETVSLHVSDLESDPRLDDPPNQEDQINVSESGGLFSYSNGTVHISSTKPVNRPVKSDVSDAESLSAPGEPKLCSAHGCALELYCSTEGKPACSKCVSDGFCQGHTVTELVTRATVVRVSKNN